MIYIWGYIIYTIPFLEICFFLYIPAYLTFFFSWHSVFMGLTVSSFKQRCGSHSVQQTNNNNSGDENKQQNKNHQHLVITTYVTGWLDGWLVSQDHTLLDTASCMSQHTKLIHTTPERHRKKTDGSVGRVNTSHPPLTIHDPVQISGHEQRHGAFKSQRIQGLRKVYRQKGRWGDGRGGSMITWRVWDSTGVRHAWQPADKPVWSCASVVCYSSQKKKKKNMNKMTS